MKQLFADGLAKMQAGDIDARLSRRPIERYQWPLGAALSGPAASFLMRERKRVAATRRGKRTKEKPGDGSGRFRFWRTGSSSPPRRASMRIARKSSARPTRNLRRR